MLGKANLEEQIKYEEEKLKPRLAEASLGKRNVCTENIMRGLMILLQA